MRIIRKRKERTPEQVSRRFKGALILLGTMMAVILLYRIATPKTEPTREQVIEKKMDALLGEDLKRLSDSLGLRLVLSRPPRPFKDYLTPTFDIENRIQEKEMQLSMSGILKEITQDDFLKMQGEIDRLKAERDSIVESLPVRMSRVLILEDAKGKKYTAVQNTDTLYTESVVSAPVEMEPAEDIENEYKEILTEIQQ